jgi:hypothetical protein
MPLRKPVSTLKQLTMDNILRHMDSFHCKSFLETLYKQNTRWRFVLSPFDDLPVKLCHEVLIALKEKKMMRKHHVNLLVSPNLSEIDLSRESGNEVGVTLQLCGVRCGERLKKLNLSFCSKIPKNVFVEEFPKLSRLSSLDLSHNNVGDEFMAVVGVYGAHLKEVDVSFTQVTDAGIRMFVMPVDEKGDPNNRFGQCRALQKLNLLNTEVTEAAVLSVLRQLPDLLELKQDNLVSAVYQRLCECPTATFKLVSLYSSRVDITDDVLAAAITACASAKLFYIATYSSMNCLSLLPMASHGVDITEIHLINTEGVNAISCVDTLTPVLAAHGASLLSLNLVEVSEVNIPLMIKLCPELVHLNIDFVSSFTTVMPHGVKCNANTVLKKLRTLNVRCADRSADDLPFNEPDENSLVQLLRAPNLSTISISGCGKLDDDAFDKVKEGNDLSLLKSLTLDKCDSITMEPLRDVILAHSPLSKVDLCKCRLIGLADVQACKKRLKKMRLLERIELAWV